jgi:hypothetical protein
MDDAFECAAPIQFPINPNKNKELHLNPINAPVFP